MENNRETRKGLSWIVAPVEEEKGGGVGGGGGRGVCFSYHRANKEHTKMMRNLFIIFASIKDCGQGC
jgi:hypothetical protein